MDQPISDELYSVVEQRVNAIRSELSVLNAQDWTGVYLLGDHHPTVFSLSPNKGFVVTSSLHTFSPSWVNFGRVSYSNGRVTVYPELTKDEKSAHTMPTEFVVVRWGKYRFLVPPPELINFAYDVHSRSGNTFVDYFVKEPESETDSDRKGLPDLPIEYLKYVHMKPIVAKVLSVKEIGDYSDGAVEIDAGRKKGVIKGMSFFLVGGKSNYVILRVTDISEDRAVCHVAGIGGGRDLPGNFWVKGWQFTSRMPKNFAGG
ncbi:MAG TPA: hypothetical protein VJ781_10925 [Pyrinomonadaceae bacterium]|nr:hypothetical protein [Pyrinomonadaceae bacterium]